MSVRRNYPRNKVIDLKTQDRRALGYYKYVNKIIGIVIAPEDIVTIYTAKKVLNATPFIHRSLTKYMNESNAARMIQLTMNLAVVAYQYIWQNTSSWFMYYTTTPSGLKKMYQCIFTNPIYGLIFYSTFYLKLIGGTSDEQKFNAIAKALQLPKHADLGVSNIIDTLITSIPKSIIGKVPSGYRVPTKAMLKSIVSNVISTVAQKTTNAVFINALKQTNPQISQITQPAVYISDRDSFDFDDTDIREQLEFVEKNSKQIKKLVKKHMKNTKNKKLAKLQLKEIVEIKNPSGDIICLNDCKQRIKTSMECYCESDCGSSTVLGGRKWCWVDPAKCKRGKYLDKFGGYAFDYCDKKNLSKKSKCFTGVSYKDCRK